MYQPTNIPTAVEASKEKVRGLHERGRALNTKGAAKLAEAIALEISAGEALSEGAEVENTAAEIGRLRAEAAVIAGAIALIRGKRRSAIRELFRAESQPLRDEAAQLQREADSIAGKTEELLKRLSENEQVSIDREVLSQLRFALPGSPSVYLNSVFLSVKADGLLKKAAVLEAREVPDSGVFDGLRAELETLGDDPLVPGPLDTELQSWLAAIDSQCAPMSFVRATNMTGQELEQCPVRYHVVWGPGGHLDCSESEATPTGYFSPSTQRGITFRATV